MPPAPGTDPKSHGLWAMTAPPPPETAPLASDARGDARVDVAVVGAGYTGLAAALRLAGAGARVTVLEAAGIGSGGAGRTRGGGGLLAERCRCTNRTTMKISAAIRRSRNISGSIMMRTEAEQPQPDGHREANQEAVQTRRHRWQGPLGRC